MRQVKLIHKGLREINVICPGLMGVALANAAVNAFFPFINIYMSSVILNAIVRQTTVTELIRYALLTVLLNALCGIIISVLKSAANFKKEEFSKLYDCRLAEKTMDLDFPDLENPEVFQKKQRIEEIRNLNAGGIWKLLEAFSGFLSSLVTVVVSVSLTLQMFFTFGGAMENRILQFVCSPAASILLLIFIGLSIYTGIYADGTVTKKMYSIMEGFVSFNRVFSYYLEHYISTYHAGKDIRLYNQKGLIDAEANALFEDADLTFTQLSRNQVKYSGIKTFSSAVLLAAIYLLVGLRALAGLFAVGNILLYINSINQFINGVNETMTHVTSLRMNQEALQAYFDYVEIDRRQKAPEKQCRVLPKEGWEIIFDHVSFRYPNTGRDVIKDLSFRIQSGKRSALVGTNGSGKTTIIKLLCRLYEPTEGKILLNGVDIQAYDYEEYIALFSVVFQDFKLLAFSLGENIAASVDYDEKLVTDCLKRAGFDDRFVKMEQGTKTPLYKDFDENGVEISGGEAQKIAIARALYKKSPFIIMDEPTAALDPVAEAGIYEKLGEIVEDKTAVFVSHRLSSCKFCDSILVFEDGRLVQDGTHDELVRDRTGLYYLLWNAQAGYYV